MEAIRVKPYPVVGFATAAAAIAHARSHVELPRALTYAAELKDAVFVDAEWTLYEWILRFDRGMSLRVWVEDSKVDYALMASIDLPLRESYQRVGSPAVLLDWSGTVGVSEMDCSALVFKRLGARFKNLQIFDAGLLVYLHDHPILQLAPVKRLSDGRSIFYACDSK